MKPVGPTDGLYNFHSFCIVNCDEVDNRPLGNPLAACNFLGLGNTAPLLLSPTLFCKLPFGFLGFFVTKYLLGLSFLHELSANVPPPTSNVMSPKTLLLFMYARRSSLLNLSVLLALATIAATLAINGDAILVPFIGYIQLLPPYFVSISPSPARFPVIVAGFPHADNTLLPGAKTSILGPKFVKDDLLNEASAPNDPTIIAFGALAGDIPLLK